MMKALANSSPSRSISTDSSVPTTLHRPRLERKCACGGTPGPTGECEECRKKREGLVQRRASGLAPNRVPPVVYDVIRSPGQPLDVSTRAFMEQRFGHDFSRVRVHTDARAAESAEAVAADAYTVGASIAFAKERFDPQGSAGQRLLAHELAHVVQQSSHDGSAESPLRMDDANGDAFERAADAAAASALEGATNLPLGGDIPTLRRKKKTALKPTPDKSDTTSSEEPISRKEEVKRSKSSPGDVDWWFSGEVLVVSLRNFAIDVDKLKSKHKQVISDLAGFVKMGLVKFAEVQVEGHADSTGSEQYNVGLSERRAFSAESVLTAKGLPPVSVIGFGETEPVAGEEAPSGRSSNRRVDILLTMDATKPSEKVQPPPKLSRPPKPRDLCAQYPFMCACNDLPLACACAAFPELCGIGLLCSLAPEICVGPAFCALYPEVCLASAICMVFPKLCFPKEDEKPPKEPIPCWGKVRIVPAKPVAGEFPIPRRGYSKLGAEFWMYLDFLNIPAEGCFCERYEYKQMVRGKFTLRLPDGTETPPRASPGEETSWRVFVEDKDPAGNVYGKRDQPETDLTTSGFDTYYRVDRKRDQLKGCYFVGHDIPGLPLLPGMHIMSGECAIMDLEFVAGAVSREERSGAFLPGSATSWRVYGEAYFDGQDLVFGSNVCPPSDASDTAT